MSNNNPNAEKQATYLNDYFDFNPLANRTRDKIFNCNAIFVNEELWTIIQEGMHDVLHDGWSVILFQIGLRYGTSVGEKARGKIPDIEQAVRFLESYGLMSGWGKFKAYPISLTMGKLVEDVYVTVEDNFFAKAIGNTNASSPRCFFISGLLAGITQGLLGEGVTCIETKCMASGHNKCEFRIIPQSDSSSH